MTLVRQALRNIRAASIPWRCWCARAAIWQPDAPVDAGGHQLPRGGPGAAGPAAGGGGSGATAAGAVASGRPAGLAVGVARAVLRPDPDLAATPVRRGSRHARARAAGALREPDPESAAPQTPVQGLVVRRAARCAGGRGPGRTTRATCWARTSTNACARPPPSCWTRATIPAPCPSRPGSRPVGDASAVRRCTRAVRRQ